MKSFIQEFKTFIMKGNVLELAIAVIMASAFKPIIDVMVSGILMPLIGTIFGERSFEHLILEVGDAQIMYGALITQIINFLLVALVVFLILKAYNKLQKKKEEAPAAPPAPTNEENLLTEIRDLLKNK